MNACMVIKAVASFLNLQLTDKKLLKEGILCNKFKNF
jgi:hypothetical protein